MDLFTAIAEMRELTRQGRSFSLIFEGYSHSKGTWTGTKRVERCILRQAPNQEQDAFAGMKLYYFDLDTKENRVAWQVLLTHFNDQELQLR